MKKSILALLLAVALVVPVFASTSSKIDVVGKVGVAVNPSVYCNTDDYDYRLTGNAKNNFMVSVEGLYNLNDKIAAGIGLNYIFATDFDTSIDNWFDDKMSIGFTNIYATIKPKLSDSIYAIAQLGWLRNT